MAQPLMVLVEQSRMVYDNMPTNFLAAAAGLADADLFRSVEHLASQERSTSVELIAHLSEIDARRAYLPRGYGSLFTYCTDTLRLSEDAAYSRILAARLARKFPVILELLGDGSVNLTTVRLLAAYLTPDNHRQVLAEATGKGKRQIEALVARLAPQPDVATSIRKLPEQTPSPGLSLGLSAQSAPASTQPAATLAEASLVAQPLLLPRPPEWPPVVAPLAPERYRIQFTVGRETYERLQRVRDLLCREVPDGDPGVIFDHALVLLLETVEKRKAAATGKPRPRLGVCLGSAHHSQAPSRYISNGVRRAVWQRDSGRCAFIASGGRRCTERKYLELHHVHPYANGGEATVENISLRCHRHNQYEAELVFGRYDPSIVQEAPAQYAVSRGARYFSLPVPEQVDVRRPRQTESQQNRYRRFDRADGKSRASAVCVNG
jgi:5-methylcytosine-specific restriction endonuclease McrA